MKFVVKRVNAFGKIEYILNGHKDRVNCVKWITQPSFGRLCKIKRNYL